MRDLLRLKLTEALTSSAPPLTRRQVRLPKVPGKALAVIASTIIQLTPEADMGGANLSRADPGDASGSTAVLTVADLSGLERRYLTKRHPEIAGRSSAVVVAADDDALLRQALALVASLQRRREQMERTIEAMLPDEVPSRAAVLQARRNAEAREALLAEFGALSSAEVAALAGSRAKNRAALANRWRKEGRILAVTDHGRTCFPGFQFDAEGQPLPVVGEVLRAIGGPSLNWQTALWFAAANGWLDGRRPVDLLASEPEGVAEAARLEATAYVF